MEYTTTAIENIHNLFMVLKDKKSRKKEKKTKVWQLSTKLFAVICYIQACGMNNTLLHHAPENPMLPDINILQLKERTNHIPYPTLFQMQMTATVEMKYLLNYSTRCFLHQFSTKAESRNPHQIGCDCLYQTLVHYS